MAGYQLTFGVGSLALIRLANPDEELTVVRRMLYGKPVTELEITDAAAASSEANDFEIRVRVEEQRSAWWLTGEGLAGVK